MLFSSFLWSNVKNEKGRKEINICSRQDKFILRRKNTEIDRAVVSVLLSRVECKRDVQKAQRNENLTDINSIKSAV